MNPGLSHRRNTIACRIIRKVFAPMRVEDWRKIQNEELLDLFFLSNVIRVIESRRTQWTWHVSRVGDRRESWKRKI